MRLTKCLALLLSLCMLLAAMPAALSEEIDIEVVDANSTDIDVDLPEFSLDLDDLVQEEDEMILDVPNLDLEQEDIPVPVEEGEVLYNNKNFTDISNSTPYVLNGVTIRAGDEGTKGSGNCWKWAQAIYKKVWGCNFDSTFEGTSSRGHNLVRNLTDDERRLTPENLKYMVSHAVPGATLRVQSCPSSCSGFNTDGCSKHKLHSLIIAEIREDGLVTMDDQGHVHTRYYSWEGFCNSWARWEFVKYIKWPKAPALASAQSVDGYGVSRISETYRVRVTATQGVGIFKSPEDSKLVNTLKYPATFDADSKTLKKFEGYTWVHGKSSTGVTGWLPLTEVVVGPNDTIAVTAVALNQTTLILAKGGTATLKAAVAPVDATNQGIAWSSSDSAVVTVSGGVIKATGAGTATVTATSEDGGLTASCTVKVADADYSRELTKTGNNGTMTLNAGETLQLIPTFATSRGWKIKSVSSSKGKYASVNKYGQVIAKKAGTTSITVKCTNGKKASLKVRVVSGSYGGSSGGGSTGSDVGEAATTTVTRIYLSKTGTIDLKVGKTIQLYTKLEPDGATAKLTWGSSNDKIAYVDGNGKVYGLKKGTCKIGVKADNGVYAVVSVRVS